jgi:hypothetical protein
MTKSYQMTKSSQNWFSIDAPAGWSVVFLRSIMAAVVAFVVLQLKEWVDAGAFDTPATAVDAGLIAGATFVLNAILMWGKS